MADFTTPLVVEIYLYICQPHGEKKEESTEKIERDRTEEAEAGLRELTAEELDEVSGGGAFSQTFLFNPGHVDLVVVRRNHILDLN